MTTGYDAACEVRDAINEAFITNERGRRVSTADLFAQLLAVLSRVEESLAVLANDIIDRQQAERAALVAEEQRLLADIQSAYDYRDRLGWATDGVSREAFEEAGRALDHERANLAAFRAAHAGQLREVARQGASDA